MARVDDILAAALLSLPPKPLDSASQSDKRGYSQRVSEVVAAALADELRQRGMKEARPAPPGVLGGSGAERRIAGGLGAKKVDVTWATEEAGLLLAISVKTINFRDGKTGNFQKNLLNRRGDMLMEAVTLHRWFPYSVLGAFFFLDAGAATDGTTKRRSTFLNAHPRLRLFTGRDDPAGRDEQFEKFYVILLEVGAGLAKLDAYEVGDAANPVSFERILDDMLKIVVERNPDFYELDAGRVVSAT